jgi:hypothetical protein
MNKSEADVQRALGTDWQVRDGIIGDCFDRGDYLGGTKRFTGLSVERLSKIIELDLCDVEDRQNDAPTIAAFHKFMQKWPDLKAHGYAVHHSRKDYRLSIEGLELRVNSVDLDEPAFMKKFRQLAAEFKKFCKGANDLRVEIKNGRLYSWWD